MFFLLSFEIAEELCAVDTRFLLFLSVVGPEAFSPISFGVELIWGDTTRSPGFWTYLYCFS